MSGEEAAPQQPGESAAAEEQNNPLPSTQHLTVPESTVPASRTQTANIQFDDDSDEKDRDEKSSAPKLRHFLSPSNRKPTKLEHAQTRFVPHRYIIRRPRALQVEYHGETYSVGDAPGQIDPESLESSRQVSRTTSGTSGSERSEEGSEKPGERSTDNIEKQRERLDLFTDLLWVGIVANLSEHYSEQSFVNGNVERAPACFIVLFLSAWSIWARLQMFLNGYYMDDTAQRILIIWVLALGLAWGNSAPHIFSSENSAAHLIGFYLVAIYSIIFTEVAYSIWLPWLRKYLLFGCLLNIPSTILWILALVYRGRTQFGLLWGAVALDKLAAIMVTSPFSARLLPGLRKAVDVKHLRKRYESFFIISLGEGVILLTRGSPLGYGLTERLGRGVLVLLCYYALYIIYFNSDGSKMSVHPVHRRWWIRAAWQFIHVFFFGALILLSSALSYLVEVRTALDEHNFEPKVGAGQEASAENFRFFRLLRTRSEGGEGGEGGDSFDTPETLQNAIITACACLAIVFACNVVFALLTRPADPPNALLINNRYVRLAPRIAAVPIFATVWLAGFQDAYNAIGVMTFICWFVFAWEWWVSFEKPCKFLEPKEPDPY